MRKILLAFISGILLILTSAGANAKGLNDSIVAIVNDDVITLKDLKDYISGIYRQLTVEHKSPREIKEVMLAYEEKGINQLVEDKLIVAAALEKGLELRPEAVDKRFKEIKAKYPNEEDFMTVLNAQGMTITDLRNKIINQMKAGYIVDVEVKQKVFVNPQDVTRYFSEHSDEFTRKAKYSLQSIYISFDKGRQEARNRIQEARSKLVAGEEFDVLHKQYSELPSVGSMEQGQMVPEIEQAVFSLNIGEVSEPVEVPGGVYIFRVTGILPSRMETLKESKDKIYNKLYDDQFQNKFKAWIDKLRAKNYVEIRD